MRPGALARARAALPPVRRRAFSDAVANYQDHVCQMGVLRPAEALSGRPLALQLYTLAMVGSGFDFKRFHRESEARLAVIGGRRVLPAPLRRSLEYLEQVCGGLLVDQQPLVSSLDSCMQAGAVCTDCSWITTEFRRAAS